MDHDNRIVTLLGDIGVYGFRDMLSNYPQRAYNIGVLDSSICGSSSDC